MVAVKDRLIRYNAHKPLLYISFPILIYLGLCAATMPYDAIYATFSVFLSSVIMFYSAILMWYTYFATSTCLLFLGLNVFSYRDFSLIQVLYRQFLCFTLISSLFSSINNDLST